MASTNTNTKNPYRRDYEILREIWNKDFQGSEEVFLTQRLVQSLVCIGLFASPATFFRFLGSKCGDRKGRKYAIEIYVFLKIGTVSYLMFWGSAGRISAVIAAVCLIDLFINLSGFVMLRYFWKPSASATRSIILLGINFFELCVDFGILYLCSRSVVTAANPTHPVTDPLSIIYFSVITSATVGYGDVVPIGVLGRCIVIVQVALSLAFFAIVVAAFVGKLSPATKS